MEAVAVFMSRPIPSCLSEVLGLALAVWKALWGLRGAGHLVFVA